MGLFRALDVWLLTNVLKEAMMKKAHLITIALHFLQGNTCCPFFFANNSHSNFQNSNFTWPQFIFVVCTFPNVEVKKTMMKVVQLFNSEIV